VAIPELSAAAFAVVGNASQPGRLESQTASISWDGQIPASVPSNRQNVAIPELSAATFAIRPLGRR
jgi:hypothetical protein